MNAKLEEVERRFERLTADLSNPDTLGDSAKLQKVAKERSSLEKLVETFRAFKRVLEEVKGVEEMLAGDPDSRAMARDELPRLKAQRDELEAALNLLLLPKDPNDEKNVILEI